MQEYTKSITNPDYVKTIAVTLNPDDNGGESVILSVDLYNREDSLYTTFSLKTYCYGISSAEITCQGFELLVKAVEQLKKELGEKYVVS